MATTSTSSVKLTNYPAIKNAPFPAEGNGQFSNIALAASVIVVPYIVKKYLPLINRGGFWTYVFVLVLTGVPTTVAYWAIMSRFGARKNEKLQMPGKPIDEYINFIDPELKEKYSKGNKIPMQIAHDAYFDGKLTFKGTWHFRVDILACFVTDAFDLIQGDCLDILEYRHDWSSFELTLDNFKYVFTNLIPEVIKHSRAQDEEQVRDHYDRGDDFYEWFVTTSSSIRLQLTYILTGSLALA